MIQDNFKIIFSKRVYTNSKIMIINKIRLFLFLTIGILCAVMVQGQESVNTSGGDATGSGGTVAYSIGQMVYTTHTGTSGLVAQGVQHAYELIIVSLRETILNISLTCFPNPTTDNVTLQISNYNNDKLLYQLYDLQGKILNSGKITGQQTQINTSSLPSATYLIKIVNQENKKSRSFNIIKSQKK